MIVNDCHCHFLSPRFFEALGREKTQGRLEMTADAVAAALHGIPREARKPWQIAGSRNPDRHHVTRAALIGSVPGDDDSIAAAVRLHPSRFVGYFALNVAAPDALERARRAFSELSLKCVCLFPALHDMRSTMSQLRNCSSWRRLMVPPSSRTAATCPSKCDRGSA